MLKYLHMCQAYVTSNFILFILFKKVLQGSRHMYKTIQRCKGLTTTFSLLGQQRRKEVYFAINSSKFAHKFNKTRNLLASRQRPFKWNSLLRKEINVRRRAGQIMKNKVSRECLRRGFDASSCTSLHVMRFNPEQVLCHSLNIRCHRYKHIHIFERAM